MLRKFGWMAAVVSLGAVVMASPPVPNGTVSNVMSPATVESQTNNSTTSIRVVDPIGAGGALRNCWIKLPSTYSLGMEELSRAFQGSTVTGELADLNPDYNSDGTIDWFRDVILSQTNQAFREAIHRNEGGTAVEYRMGKKVRAIADPKTQP